MGMHGVTTGMGVFTLSAHKVSSVNSFRLFDNELAFSIRVSSLHKHERQELKLACQVIHQRSKRTG